MTTLQKAVVKQLGYEELDEDATSTLQDVANHGAQGGFSGFIYYKDTCEFYAENKSEIWELLNASADDQGITPIELIATFGGQNTVASADTFENLLAWFALEETANTLTND